MNNVLQSNGNCRFFQWQKSAEWLHFFSVYKPLWHICHQCSTWIVNHGSDAQTPFKPCLPIFHHCSAWVVKQSFGTQTKSISTAALGYALCMHNIHTCIWPTDAIRYIWVDISPANGLTSISAKPLPKPNSDFVFIATSSKILIEFIHLYSRKCLEILSVRCQRFSSDSNVLIQWVIWINIGPGSSSIKWQLYCSDVIMGTIESQITSLTIVYATVDSGADQRKHQMIKHGSFVSTQMLLLLLYPYLKCYRCNIHSICPREVTTSWKPTNHIWIHVW